MKKKKKKNRHFPTYVVDRVRSNALCSERAEKTESLVSGIKCPRGIVWEQFQKEIPRERDLSRKERPKNLAPFRAVRDVINRGLFELIGSLVMAKGIVFLVVVSVVAMPRSRRKLKAQKLRSERRLGRKIDRSEFVSGETRRQSRHCTTQNRLN